ncbi:VOC family protein [Pseudoalteromonas sp. T1lg65]|uniref:VOC family protein n=1 Tax=Pseudoalteromonas sp. T1lg65 TaxID=2077101 RepID=UPI003F7B13DA
MSVLTKVELGRFCWVELCSSDWQAVKPFYRQLFDWQVLDQPIGDDCFYTIMQKHGDDVAAMYQMTAEQQQTGANSFWLAYIAVEDVNSKIDKAKTLGAEVLVGPHDIPDAGRMVMLQEPGGAVFALWQAKDHIGIKRTMEANVPYWFELASRDAEASRTFYSQLFDWEIELKPMGSMDYTLFKVDGCAVGGMLEMTEEWGDDIPPHWMTYFAVLDCDSCADFATQLGGTVCVPPTDVPEVGKFAVITDPSGAVFSVIESSMDEISA